MARLDSNLTSVDTFSIATGAMFSSGFFVLPGLAAAMTGTSMVGAYLVAGLLMVPAMWCQAELATAMPRAGGAYFFVDRAMGPMAGTVAGLTTWVALVLKSAFALVGLGAYLHLWTGLPAAPVAVGTGAVFVLFNLRGAHHSARIQVGLVAGLLTVLGTFLTLGYGRVGVAGLDPLAAAFTDPLLHDGFGGFAATVALVSVSYAGLTKVASVAEEVARPDRDVPLGMFLALPVTTGVYVLGTGLALLLLPADQLHGSVAPMVEAARVAAPGVVGQGLAIAVGVAALIAFATTANAGILAASRYPFAMARDGLVPERLATIRDGVPTTAVAFTSVAVLGAACLDIMAVAKLASAVQLMLFVLLAVSVVIMRESRLVSYAPGFHAPLYPWVPVATIVTSLALLWALGSVAVAFALVLSASAAAYYLVVLRGRVPRRGMVWHAVERWAAARCDVVEQELHELLAERALRDDCHRRDRVRSERLDRGSALAVLLDHPDGYDALPDGVTLVQVVRRGRPFAPSGVRPEVGDQMVLLGWPHTLHRLMDPLAGVPFHTPPVNRRTRSSVGHAAPPQRTPMR